MSEALTQEEYVKILTSIVKRKNIDTIELMNQNITDIKLYQSIIHFTNTSKYKLAEYLKSISKLYLDDNKFIYGYKLLFNIIQISNITFLSLHNNKMDDVGTILLAKHLCNTWSNTYLENLEYLDISQNLIGYQGAEAIADALKTHKYLIELDMNDNNIGSEGANYIGEMLKLNTSIQIINLTDNNIDMYNSYIFAEGISINTTLYNLEIGCNNFNDGIIHSTYENIEKVFNLILSSKNIKYLVFDFADIDDIMAQYIANELKTNNIVTELSLRGTEISNEGAYLLFDALKTNPNTVLKTLTLATTSIDNECLGSFAELLGDNDILQSVDMYNTEVDNDGLLELSKRRELKYNESIVVLTFGQEDIEEEVPIGNNYITYILNRNKLLFWKPYLHNFEIFNIEMHLIIMSTLLCNIYGNLRVRLPMEVMIYIFKFFNRANFLNY
jgi:Ran GTPase-activating protein (RanGAP) involved in mRNA processing and transport